MRVLPMFSIHNKEMKLELILHLAKNQELKRGLHKEEKAIADDEKKRKKN